MHIKSVLLTNSLKSVTELFVFSKINFIKCKSKKK